MKFISVRDLKAKSSLVWKELPQQKDMVITNNGRPVAVLSSITEDNLEQVLSSFRQARAMKALDDIQYQSVQNGNDTITLDEINEEIKAVRAKRKK